MRNPLIFALLVLSLLGLSGCEASQAEAATVEPGMINISNHAPSGTIAAELADEYRYYQAIFDAASMEQTLFHKYDDILVRFSDAMQGKQEITLRIQRLDGRIYGERITWVEAGSLINLGEAYVLPDGEFEVVLMPTPGVYYQDGVRAERRIVIRVQVRQ